MKPHKLDPISLVLGAVVIGIGVVFAADVHNVRWVGPTLLVAFGLILVAAAVQRAMHSSDA